MIRGQRVGFSVGGGVLSMSEDVFEQLKSVYGSLDGPTYFKINEVMDQQPYAQLVQELANLFSSHGDQGRQQRCELSIRVGPGR